jgi:hypothetical protein
MLHRIFILSIFSILCICLIYFTLKNKNLETFEEKRIIVRSGDIQDTEYNLFSYNKGEKIQFSKSLTDDNKKQAIFFDYENIQVDFIPLGVIQVIFVEDSLAKYKINLNDDGTVTIDGSSTDLNDIIQIAPCGTPYFIALTSYNTLLKYHVSEGSTLVSLSEVDPIDPIISVQGFVKSNFFVYLTMSGNLYKVDLSTSESDPTLSRIYPDDANTNLKIIQFNVPTYATVEFTTLPYSCIAIDDSFNKTVCFYDGSNPIIKYNQSKTITTVVIKNDDKFECYQVLLLDDGKLYEFDSSTIYLNNFIDSKIYNIISAVDKIYYVKNGQIYCDGLNEGTSKEYFNLGNNCVTCGVNAIQDGSDQCKCEDTDDIRHRNNTDNADSFTFDPAYDEIGCFDYNDCVQISPGTECGDGLWLNPIELTKSTDANLPENVGGESSTIQCPACSACSKTARDAVIKGGKIVWGRSSENTGEISPPHLCADGRFSSGVCEYYVKDQCTPTTDTVFAKKTLVTDLQGVNESEEYPGDYNKYISDTQKYNAGSVSSSTDAISGRDDGTEQSLLGTPATNWATSVGQDDVWEDCIDVSCCQDAQGLIVPTSYKLIPTSLSEERYDCTKGNKRTCDNCADEYSCSLDTRTSFFNIPFANDYCGSDMTECSINTLLSSCGTNDSGKIKISDFLHNPSELCSRVQCGYDGGGAAGGGAAGGDYAAGGVADVAACSGLFPQDCLSGELSSCSVFTS